MSSVVKGTEAGESTHNLVSAFVHLQFTDQGGVSNTAITGERISTLPRDSGNENRIGVDVSVAHGCCNNPLWTWCFETAHVCLSQFREAGV